MVIEIKCDTSSKNTKNGNRDCTIRYPDTQDIPTINDQDEFLNTEIINVWNECHDAIWRDDKIRVIDDIDIYQSTQWDGA